MAHLPPGRTYDSRRIYVEDRDTTAVLAGSRSHETSFTEAWTLGLSEDAEHPWRIVAAGLRAPAPS
jgi:hypothetical protein